MSLASSLRARFGSAVDVRIIDAWLEQRRYHELIEEIEEFQPDVLGLSALNFEAEESGRIADLVRERLPETIIALGGPFAHGQMNVARICATGVYDWVFDGEADLSFPIAVERWFVGDQRLADIIGLTWRDGESYTTNGCATHGGEALVGAVGDLDELPFPAWDLVDFDAYASRINNNGNLRGRRYAPIFTSRGCPFLCTYCHDIFGKKFRWRSPANVIAEVQLLRDVYGVDELQIVDDIFNMNSRRMKEICAGLAPLKMHICFPNGLRGDILDEAGCHALVDAGMYEVAVAIETVTPRLQDMVKKRLHMDALQRSIKTLAGRGVMVKGFFMLGFPTETVAEMEATIDFAVKSQLAHAVFSLVTPQPGTPLFDEAMKVNSHAIETVVLNDYYAATCWYSEAYGVDVHAIRSRAYARFYLSSPLRIYRILRGMSWKDLFRGFYYWARKVFLRTRSDAEVPDALPAALQPLRKLYPTDDTSNREHSNRPLGVTEAQLEKVQLPVLTIDQRVPVTADLC